MEIGYAPAPKNVNETLILTTQKKINFFNTKADNKFNPLPDDKFSSKVKDFAIPNLMKMEGSYPNS